MKNERVSNLPIFALIAAAFLVRLVLALIRTDSHWPDEQFQTLEPAGKVIFGYGTLAWEWTSGYRSWVVPGIYMPLFAIQKYVFGVNGGLGTILASRALTAVCASVVILQLDRVLKRLELSRWSRFVGLAALSFSTSMILWSSATLGDTWGMIVIWGVLPAIIDKSRSRLRRDWIWLGFLAGLTGLIKLQLGAWVLGLGIALFLGGAPLRLLGWAAFGGFLDFLALGLLDAVTLGAPFHSVTEQFSKGKSIASFYGVAPWWGYFPSVLQDLGAPIFVAIAALFLVTVVFPSLRTDLFQRFRASYKTLLIIFLPALTFLAALLPIEHKEERFLLPILPAIFVFLSLLAEPLITRAGALTRGWEARFEKTPVLRLLFAGVFGITLACASMLAIQSAGALPLYLSAVDISPLEGAIHDDQGLSPGGESCVLLIDHNWSWTRGQLILGAPIRLVDEKLEKINAIEFAQCSYAILRESQESQFLAKAGPAWKEMKRSRNGFVLYRHGLTKGAST